MTKTYLSWRRKSGANEIAAYQMTEAPYQACSGVTLVWWLKATSWRRRRNDGEHVMAAARKCRGAKKLTHTKHGGGNGVKARGNSVSSSPSSQAAWRGDEEASGVTAAARRRLKLAWRNDRSALSACNDVAG